MEAYEREILTRSDTDGVELTWGNPEAVVEMVHKMGRGEGIGRLMTEGSKRMAEALGKNAIEFAIHVKGLEPSAHDPRRFFSQHSHTQPRPGVPVTMRAGATLMNWLFT